MLKLRFPLPVFRTAKEVVNGKNARMALKGLAANKVTLIISGSFKNSQYYDQINRLIKCESLQVLKKSWAGEPSLEEMAPVMSQVEEFQPDFIIALGGGSVIDGAKLIWLLYEAPQLTTEQIFRPFSLPQLRGRCKFAVIPTTIGAGAEVSSAAVMYDKSSGSKKAVVTHDFLPDLVILDPELVLDVPTNILLTTVADALSHAVEGYMSKISHPLMDTFAEKAIAIIANNWQEISAEQPSLALISELQHAAMMAGWVQNHCLVGMSHAIAHQLSGYGINHGIANGILMTKVIPFNCRDEKVTNRYEQLTKNSGLNSVKDLIELFSAIIIASTEHTVFFDKDINLDRVAKGAMLDPAAKSNPIVFNEQDVKEVLKACLI
ncbi:MAG: alcohol dehydrogenase [Gammaproteobacteria bacterium]|nr:MAG: alcohol dehydrogenase [Gammaproteobacteria bacterium]